MEVARAVNGTAPAPPPPPAPSAAAGTGQAPAPAPMPVQVQAPPLPTENRPAERQTDGGEVLRRAVREVNASIETYGRHLGIRVHEATGRHLVTVYDSTTNEMIREIPPERVLDAHAGLLELAGLFVDTRG